MGWVCRAVFFKTLVILFSPFLLFSFVRSIKENFYDREKEHAIRRVHPWKAKCYFSKRLIFPPSWETGQNFLHTLSTRTTHIHIKRIAFLGNKTHFSNRTTKHTHTQNAVLLSFARQIKHVDVFKFILHFNYAKGAAGQWFISIIPFSLYFSISFR